MATSSALTKARDHLEKARAYAQRMRAKGEETVGEVVDTVEVVGGSIGGGFLDEKFGADEGDGIKVYKVHGIPANLLLGSAGLMGGFFGIAGKHSAHVCGVAKGFAAAYGVNVGRAIAKKTETVV